MTNSTPQADTISQINALLRQLQEGDRQRVLRFCEDVLVVREATRSTRRKRFQKPVVDNWRIGS